MAEEIYTKYRRATSEQIQEYVAFLRTHPELQTKRSNSSRQKLLWNEVARRLNDMKGPTRSAAKWREALGHWKNQLLSRARKEKDYIGINSPFAIIKTLSTIGVEGQSDVPALSFQEENPNEESTSPCDSMTFEDINNIEDSSNTLPMDIEELLIKEEPKIKEEPPSPSTILTSQENELPEECFQIHRSASRASIDCSPSIEPPTEPKGKISSNAVFKNILEIMEKRDGREKHYQQEILSTQKAMADGLKSLGEGMKSMAEAMKYLSETLVALNKDIRRPNGTKPS